VSIDYNKYKQKLGLQGPLSETDRANIAAIDSLRVSESLPSIDAAISAWQTRLDSAAKEPQGSRKGPRETEFQGEAESGSEFLKAVVTVGAVEGAQAGLEAAKSRAEGFEIFGMMVNQYLRTGSLPQDVVIAEMVTAAAESYAQAATKSSFFGGGSATETPTAASVLTGGAGPLHRMSGLKGRILAPSTVKALAPTGDS
jgi:hypothetical protein